LSYFERKFKAPSPTLIMKMKSLLACNYEEDSSSDTLPPPPPSEIGFDIRSSGVDNMSSSKTQTDDEKYHEQLRIFRGRAEFSNALSFRESDEDNYEDTSDDEYDDDDDDDDDGDDHNDYEEASPSPTQGHYHQGIWQGQRPKRREMKKPVLYGCIAASLLILIATIVSVGIATGSFQGGDKKQVDEGESSSFSSASPGPSTDEFKRADRLRQYLISVGNQGAAMFNDPFSSASQALEWMQNDDPAALDPIDRDTHLRIDQRFALLTLWFQSDLEWFDQTDWLSDDECTWYGITCILVTPGFRSRHLKELTENFRRLKDGDKLVALVDLENNNLQGKIPADLGLLKWLKTLNLSKNNLSGEIPSTLSSLKFLKVIYLDTCNLKGELTLDFSALQDLVEIDVSNNQIDGAIPASLWTVPRLQHINLSNNSFVGIIPEEVENLENIGKCTLVGCAYVGVSPEWVKLANP
jgi:hypothetical protein